MKRCWFKRMVGTAGLLALILTVALAGPGKAVEFTNDGVVAAGQIVDDDLFIDADRATIDGTVNGDLFITSETVQVNGTVNGNLMVYSAALVLNGTVNGSLVFAGQGAEIAGDVTGTVYAASNMLRLTPTARIKRNIFYAGYALEALPGSEIGRDIYFTGYQALIDSQAVRNLNLAANAITIGAQVERDVQLEVDGPGRDDEFIRLINSGLPPLPGIEPIPMASAGLRIVPGASIGGALVYTSPVDQSAAIQSRPGAGVTFHRSTQTAAVEPTSQELAAAWFIARFQELATLLILGGLAASLIPALLQRVAIQAGQRPHVNAWKGLLVLVMGFALAVLAFLTILIVGILISVVSLGGLSKAVFGIGLSGLAAVFGLFLFMISFGSKLILAQMGGAAILQRFAPSLAEHRYWPVIVGILIYILLRSIPVVSQLVGLAATMIGLGAAWLAFRRRSDEMHRVIQMAEAAA